MPGPEITHRDYDPTQLAALRETAQEWKDKPGVWAARLVPDLIDKIEQLRAQLTGTQQLYEAADRQRDEDRAVYESELKAGQVREQGYRNAILAQLTVAQTALTQAKQRARTVGLRFPGEH